jgi:hypothetical protein
MAKMDSHNTLLTMAGHTRPSNQQQVRVDTTAPAVAATPAAVEELTNK